MLIPRFGALGWFLISWQAPPLWTPVFVKKCLCVSGRCLRGDPHSTHPVLAALGAELLGSFQEAPLCV